MNGSLCRDKVRFVGDPVAAVIARDEQTASEALALIDVSYKPLPTIADAEQALAACETPLQDYAEEGNIHRRLSYSFGDVDQALEEADHVFEDTFLYESNTHMAMEQHASVAAADPDGRVTLWSSTQCPHYVHRALAKALEIPAAHIRVIACPQRWWFRRQDRPRSITRLSSPGHPCCLADRSRFAWPVKKCSFATAVSHQVTMKFRTCVSKDDAKAERGCNCRPCWTAAPMVPTGIASTFYTAALQPVTYQLTALQLRCLPCFHQQAALRPQTRSRYAAAALWPGNPA